MDFLLWLHIRTLLCLSLFSELHKLISCCRWGQQNKLKTHLTYYSLTWQMCRRIIAGFTHAADAEQHKRLSGVVFLCMWLYGC